jgi:hypothetical protein
MSNENKDYYLQLQDALNTASRHLFHYDKSLDYRTWMNTATFINTLYAEFYSVVEKKYAITTNKLSIPTFKATRRNSISIHYDQGNNNRWVEINIPAYRSSFDRILSDDCITFTAGIFEDSDYVIQFSGMVNEPKQVLFLLFYLL